MDPKEMKKNIKDAVTKKSALKDWGLAVAGGLTYPIIPTVIESIAGIDMTGRKGAVVGVIGASLIGFASGNSAFAAGAMGAFAGHVAYTELNGSVIEPVLGKFLFRYDPSQVNTMADNAEVELQPGAESHQLPNGVQSAFYAQKQLPAPQTAPAAPGVADNYQQSLMDNYQQGVPQRSNQQANSAPMATHAVDPEYSLN